jgi:hypothetical protein
MASLQPQMDGLFEYKHNAKINLKIMCIKFLRERGQNLNIFWHTKPNELAHLA